MIHIAFWTFILWGFVRKFHSLRTPCNLVWKKKRPWKNFMDKYFQGRCFFKPRLEGVPKLWKFLKKNRNERFRTRYESCQNLSVQLKKFAKLQHFYQSGKKFASQSLILDIVSRRAEQRALCSQRPCVTYYSNSELEKKSKP